MFWTDLLVIPVIYFLPAVSTFAGAIAAGRGFRESVKAGLCWPMIFITSRM